MLLSIEHATAYAYDGQAWDSFNELRLQPADDYRQTLLHFDVTVDPEASVRTRRDYYDNTVHHFHLPGRHPRMELRARSVVSTYGIPTPQVVPSELLPELRHRFFEYLSPTDRVPLNDDWLGIFGSVAIRPGDDVVTWITDLTAHLRRRLAYQSESTTVDTPLADFAKTQVGVCQDFAHAMLAICRSVGIPSRYVSGYVHANPSGDEAMIGAEGSHAWVEVYLPGSGWIGFDPTNGCIINQAHVKLAVGRDYDDVPPVRGLRRGATTESLTVEVAVRHTDPADLPRDTLPD
jgi:transglutaminase-like putative cysteine protease